MDKILSVENNRCSAAKHPNVSRRPCGTIVEGESSQTIPMSGLENTIII